MRKKVAVAYLVVGHTQSFKRGEHKQLLTQALKVAIVTNHFQSVRVKKSGLCLRVFELN
jgi:hypothetical protein